MGRIRMLTAVPALLLLAACGGDEPAGDTAGGTAASSPTSPEAPAPGPAESSPGDDSATAPADVEIEDQSGSGDSAVVARVSAPDAGFVVILLDEDDDRPVGERLLGVAAVPAGVSTDVEVSLDPPLQGGETDIEAVLYADTDGDGEFDPATDRPVPEADDDDDDDDDDVVDDDADYRVA